MCVLLMHRTVFLHLWLCQTPVHPSLHEAEHRLSPDKHKWHQSTSSLGTFLPTYSKYIAYITHTWARKCILLSNCIAQTTNYSLSETDKQVNDCTQLPNLGCQASNKSLDWFLLHFTQFKIMIPIFYTARRSQQHLAGQMVTILDCGNRTFNRTWPLLGPT